MTDEDGKCFYLLSFIPHPLLLQLRSVQPVVE